LRFWKKKERINTKKRGGEKKGGPEDMSIDDLTVAPPISWPDLIAVITGGGGRGREKGARKRGRKKTMAPRLGHR